MTQRALMYVRLADDADRDIDDVWWHVATESASTEIADRLVDRISDRYSQLAKYPYMGPSRPDLGSGRRSLNAGQYVIVYKLEESEVRILRIVHGHRDLPGLFDL